MNRYCLQTNMHASFPYDNGRNSSGGGGGSGGSGRGVEYGSVRRPDALLPPPGLDQTDLVLHTSLVDDPQVSFLFNKQPKLYSSNDVIVGSGISIFFHKFILIKQISKNYASLIFFFFRTQMWTMDRL